MTLLTALVAGLLFGAGLLLSGMVNPAIVLGFLDVGGDWNPALVFTMAGAIAVLAPVSYLVRRGRITAAGPCAPAATPRRIDRALMIGAVIFGLGWGLSGICPGPGLMLLTTLGPAAFAFVAAMIVGMLGTNIVARVDGPDG
ncbi:MAG TPA: DUF6691 family protein [Steroidobacteraceae bacterium]